MGEQDSTAVIPKKDEAIEATIIQYVKKGWEDGEYAVGKFKNDIDTLLKSKHNSFMLDFRNFCDEVCKKGERHVENPSLANLLKFVTIQFCAKVDTYFFDIHKSLLLRYFSVTRKVLQLIISLSNSNSLSIDGK